MKELKAVIVEINKESSIVLTSDGQFRKERITAGNFEIGDEIMVSAEDTPGQPVSSSRFSRIITRTAIGFAAVALIVVGTYFSFQYFTNNTFTGEIAKAADEALPGVKQDETILAVENAPEAMEGALTEEEMVGISRQELVAGIYSLEKIGMDIPIENDGISIIYRIDRSPGETVEMTQEDILKELTLKFLNIKKESMFSGNADIFFIKKDLSTSDIHTINFKDLSHNQQVTEKMTFVDDTGLLTFTVWNF